MRTRSLSRSAGLASILLVAAVMLMGTGCATGSGGAGRPTTGASSASVTTTPTSAAPPTLPPAALVPSRDGAAAFARFFVARINIAYGDASPDPLVGLGLPSCTFCAELVDDLSSAQARSEKYTGGAITPKSVVAAPGDPSSGLIVNLVVDQTTGKQLTAGGGVIREYPARTSMRMDIGVKWVQGKWGVVEVSIPR